MDLSTISTLLTSIARTVNFDVSEFDDATKDAYNSLALWSAMYMFQEEAVEQQYTADKEALVMTHYAVRNSDVVETALHSEGQRLDNRLMPRFTGEIAWRVSGFLQLKAAMSKDKAGQKAWQDMIVRLWQNQCAEWEMVASPTYDE